MSCTGCDNCGIPTAGERLFYQVHVTIEPDKSLTAFTLMTTAVPKGKAYRFENILRDGSRQLQWLTSETVEGNFELAKARMYITQQSLKSYGFKIIRSKIECSPNCPEVDKSSKGYYECHLKVKLSNDPIHEQDNTLYSRNLDNLEWTHATMRLQGYRYDVVKSLSSIWVYCGQQDSILGRKWDRVSEDPVVIEYTAYDSNRDLDKEWECG